MGNSTSKDDDWSETVFCCSERGKSFPSMNIKKPPTHVAYAKTTQEVAMGGRSLPVDLPPEPEREEVPDFVPVPLYDAHETEAAAATTALPGENFLPKSLRPIPKGAMAASSFEAPSEHEDSQGTLREAEKIRNLLRNGKAHLCQCGRLIHRHEAKCKTCGRLNEMLDVGASDEKINMDHILQVLEGTEDVKNLSVMTHVTEERKPIQKLSHEGVSMFGRTTSADKPAQGAHPSSPAARTGSGRVSRTGSGGQDKPSPSGMGATRLSSTGAPSRLASTGMGVRLSSTASGATSGGMGVRLASNASAAAGASRVGSSGMGSRLASTGTPGRVASSASQNTPPTSKAKPRKASTEAALKEGAHRGAAAGSGGQKKSRRKSAE